MRPRAVGDGRALSELPKSRVSKLQPFLGIGRTNPRGNNYDQQTPHELIPSFALLIPSSLTDPMGHCPISPLMPPHSHVTLPLRWVITSGPRLWSGVSPGFFQGERIQPDKEEDSVSPHSARHACHVVSNVSHPQTSLFPKWSRAPSRRAVRGLNRGEA